MQLQDKPIEGLTAAECRLELSGETDLNRLRSLVGLKRVLEEVRGTSCTLTADVQEGKVRNWRYPRQLKVS